MEQLAHNRRHLRLAYSADDAKTTTNLSDQDCSSKETWGQLKLFDEPDTVIFAEPAAYSLHELIGLLRNSNVSQILDLRLIPHFSFEGATRSGFFEHLHLLNVKYYRLTTTEESIEEVHSKGYALVSKYIARGPSMVFSDIEPTRDSDIVAVTHELSRSGVRCKQVFASIE